MALIKLDDELDRWIEEVSALPPEDESAFETMTSIPVIDTDLVADMQWTEGLGFDPNFNAEQYLAQIEDEINTLRDDEEDYDDDDHDDIDLPF